MEKHVSDEHFLVITLNGAGAKHTYACDKCDQVFYQLENVTKHIQTSHKQTTELGVCPSSVSRPVIGQLLPILLSHCLKKSIRTPLN